MTEQQEEQRRYALAISGGVCEVCGKPLGAHAQGAHKIANKEQYKERRITTADEIIKERV